MHCLSHKNSCKWQMFLCMTVLVLSLLGTAGEEESAVRPQSCTMECIQQESSECNFCRITPQDTQIASKLGLNVQEVFGGCIPKPCFALMDDRNLCEHYVKAPEWVDIQFVETQDVESDTVLIRWRPSPFGISFLRGFQVLLQGLTGDIGAVKCQLYLFNRGLQLEYRHKDTVYESDPFSGLLLGVQYAVTVIALPVPEKWENFSHRKFFRARSCLPKEKTLPQCRSGWYPSNVSISREGSSLVVTFNLAPSALNINSYVIFYKPESSEIMQLVEYSPPQQNQTYGRLVLFNLTQGMNYTIEVAANFEDPIRKTVYYFLSKSESIIGTPSGLGTVLLIVLVPSVILFLVILAVFITRWRKQRYLTTAVETVAEKNFLDSKADEHLSVALLWEPKLAPKIFVCYSSLDGPKHTDVVLRFAAYLQEYCGCRVALDIWDELSIAEEGKMGWLCRQIEESDYILVVCSKGLKYYVEKRPEGPGYQNDSECGKTFVAAIYLIAEKLRQARIYSFDVSKFVTVFFEYSGKYTIPGVLDLATNYGLMEDFPQLFAHLHGMQLSGPGHQLHVEHVSKGSYFRTQSGFALYMAINDMCQFVNSDPQWFERLVKKTTAPSISSH